MLLGDLRLFMLEEIMLKVHCMRGICGAVGCHSSVEMILKSEND